MAARMGSQVADQCMAELKKKAFSEKTAAEFNERITDLWPILKKELEPFIIPVPEMESLLKAAGGPTTAGELGLQVDFYREAVRHNHEMRNRFSFVDITAEAGILDAFAQAEV